MMTNPRQENIALAVTSHSRTERFVPLVRQVVDAFWPTHPQRFFITDGISQPGEDVVSYPGLAWVELLIAGLHRIGQVRPRTTHIFHMLEDHCPLRACDDGRLARIFDIAVSHDLAAVSFPTYSWPWNETDAAEYPDGLVRTWRHRKIRDFDGELLAEVPRDFFRYFQVQPTLWRLDYLRAACHEARTQGIADAWGFEAMRWPQAAQHYVSRYDWPTVHHGFLVQGKINAAAVAYLDRREVEEAHRALVREAIGVESPLLFDSLQMIVRTGRQIRQGLADVKRRVAARAQ